MSLIHQPKIIARFDHKDHTLIVVDFGPEEELELMPDFDYWWRDQAIDLTETTPAICDVFTPKPACNCKDDICEARL